MEAAIERVQLVFNLTNIIDVQTANNQLYMAVGPTTIIHIDLDHPTKIHDLQLPPAKAKQTLSKLWAHPLGVHLIAQTDSGFYYINGDLCRVLRLPSGQLGGLAYYNDLAFIAIQNTLYTLDLAPLKIERKKEVVKRVQALQDTIRSVAVVKHELWALTDISMFQSDITNISLVETSHNVPNDGHLIANKTQWAIAHPHGIEDSSGKIETKVEQALISRYYYIVYADETISFYNVVSRAKILSIPAPQHVMGGCSDIEYHTHWVFDSSNLYEVKLDHETLGMWQIYVQSKQFENALAIASSQDRNTIYFEYANDLFAQEEYLKAAEYYGQSRCHIEGVALEFIKLQNTAALKQLFRARLAVTKNQVQQAILGSLVVELMLQGNDFDEFQKFAREFSSKLDNSAVLKLLQAHANDDQILWFANFTKDYKFVVDFAISQSMWDEALESLRQHEDEESIYKYASILLSRRPQATVESWMRIHKLDPLRLLPSLLAYSSEYRGNIKDHQAVRYLRHCIATNNTSTELLNALLMIFARSDSEEDLLAYLEQYSTKFFDYNFGLRVCLENRKVKCAIYLYTQMSLYEEAVNLCLKEGLEDQAIEIVEQKIDSEQQRKNLWLEIARRVVEKKGTHTALKFIDRINIEDLLELFPDFETLDHMAPEVVKALEASSHKLRSIHKEMQSAIKAGEDMQAQIKSFNKRYVLIEPGEPCQHCKFPLATRRFYVFPCQHGFHLDCIVTNLEKGSNSTLIQTLKEQHKDPQDLVAALDPIVSAECLICSESRIDEIDLPLSVEF